MKGTKESDKKDLKEQLDIKKKEREIGNKERKEQNS